MKKLKEFLLLFLPLILLIGLPIVIFSFSQSGNAFISNSEYLRLFLKDGIFWDSIFYTYRNSLIYSGIAVLICVFLCHFIKPLKKRKIFYPAGVIVASVVAFITLLVSKTSYFGLPMGVYDPEYLVSNTAPKVSVSVYDVFMALQVGFFVVLLVWILETVFVFVKKFSDKKGKGENV